MEETNINTLTKIIEFDDIDVSNDNEENNNIITDDMYIDNNSRYENIIELLGLNININYPINVISNGIIEMYMINVASKNKSKYARSLKFIDNPIAKKLGTNIIGHSYTNDNHLSIMSITSNLKRIYRQHKYNKIIKNIDTPIINKNNESNLGFNYNNPRWNNLTSFVI